VQCDFCDSVILRHFYEILVGMDRSGKFWEGKCPFSFNFSVESIFCKSLSPHLWNKNISL